MTDVRPAVPARSWFRPLHLAGRGWLWPTLGAVSLLLTWALLSWALGPETFPGVGATLDFLGREVRRGAIWGHVGITLWRVLAAFVLALLAGIPLGIALGRFPTVAAFAAPWLAVGLTLPRILILLAAYLIIGLNERAIILSITVILLPTVAVQVREGVRSLDPRLAQMARSFQLSRAATLRAVTLPQLTPTLLGTARVTLSLAWKMVVFGEVFGRTSGVGYMISFYFQQFEMRGILAYGLVMTVILSALDGLLALISTRAAAWQGNPPRPPEEL
ncbi:ABC transporter permease subunit [Deinococcus sp. KSM4-11]|uniref:ABC transporter permease n=1 Tax=Deinococcus sp. KSM4-11 TaxID=2568654 RepID=UPI0010A515B3|nr:ABC transporter permease subunit [Deinococcus sp. KSM4-11]THF88631.1 ABC transporter permease subunit [Deinococcus sp. KSM4-11]